MIPTGAMMMDSAPSFQASSSAAASAESGSIYGSNTTGQFVVGGNEKMIWIFVLAAAVALAWIYFGSEK